LSKKYLLIGLLLALAVSLVVTGCGTNTVAVVNGENITRQELDERLALVKADFEAQGVNFDGEQGKEFMVVLENGTLEQMIDEVLLMQEAKNLGFEPGDKEVANKIKEFRESFDAEGDYRRFLAANGLSEPKLKDLVRQQLIIEALVEHISKDVRGLKESEIRAYYDENKDYYTQPEQRRVRHILIGSGDGSGRSDMEAKVEALKVIERLQAGEDFVGLVAEKSEDPGSNASGGEYTFSRGQGFVSEFEDAAFNLTVGEYTPEPVRTNFGYHIIKLEEIISARVQPFEEVQSDIKASLLEKKKGKHFEDYLAAQREKAEIQNNLVKNESGATKN
jgi:peptidyl-prolyl cis-trans isomerase C